MNHLWAPWRKAYVTGAKKEKGCLFCLKFRSKSDKSNLVLDRSKRAFSLLNLYPYQNGHVMVAPVRHVSGLEQLSDAETLDLIRHLNMIKKRIEKSMNPDGMNIGINFGRAGGAGITGHVHIHIVPRWVGDHNFMPVISNTKVISESLKSVYERLKYAHKKTAGRTRK